MNYRDTEGALLRSAVRFFSGTLISRISGMVRDIVMAFCFGASGAIAAFLVAYRLVYLVRRLFGEGLLHQGFIPHFEGIRRVDPKRGAQFFRDLFGSLFFFLLLFVLGGEVTLYLIGGESARLAMWMLPGIFFICLFGLSSALLQAERQFFLPSVSPVLSNCVWIAGMLVTRGMPIDLSITWLSAIISFAFFVQFAATIPGMWRFLREYLSRKEVRKIVCFAPEVRLLIKPLLLGMIGVASVQVNGAIDVIFARFAADGGPVYLWYAIRLQQLPLALFGIALSSALLPSLSRAIEIEERGRFHELLRFAYLKSFALILPCVLGIFLLGASSVNLLFGRGDFSQIATAETVFCLWGYGFGLLPTVFIQILATTFYAKKDYKTPAIGFFLAALGNTILNGIAIFYFDWGTASIAYVTSIMAIFNVLYLQYHLREKPAAVLSPFFKLLFCSIGAALLVFPIGRWMGDGTGNLLEGNVLFTRSTPLQLIQFVSQATLYFIFFFAGCALSGVLKLYRFSFSK